MTLRLGIILLPLIAPAVLLPLSACTDKEIETNVALLRGDPPPDAGMYMADIPASSEEAADEPVVVETLAATEPSSSEYVATAHQVCPEPFEWRGQLVQNPCTVEYW